MYLIKLPALTRNRNIITLELRNFVKINSFENKNNTFLSRRLLLSTVGSAPSGICHQLVDGHLIELRYEFVAFIIK